MKHESTLQRLHSQQQGVIAIFSVLVIMGILTLLTIGFSSMVRQAQKRTLDDHLHTQAFYAAESGVNIALAAMQDGVISQDKNDCEPDGLDYNIDSVRSIAITCLMVKRTVTSVDHMSVPIESEGGSSGYLGIDTGSIKTIRIKWSATESGTSIRDTASTPGNPQFYTSEEWGTSLGVLKVELVPVDNPNILGSREGLVNEGYIFYMYPTTNESFGDPDYDTAPGPDGHGQVMVVGGNGCTDGAPSTPASCLADISLTGDDNSSYFYKISSVYNRSNVSMSVSTDGPGEDFVESNIVNSQAIIDSTARANDVFRRVQVRVPISNEYTASIVRGIDGVSRPPYALFADAVCKRYVIFDDKYENHGDGPCEED